MKITDIKLIYLSEFIARFCTWSIFSSLLMHITQSNWVTMPKALYIVGISFSLLYLCSMLGGYVKDRFFDEKKTIMLGIFLIALGNIGLLSSTFFYGGLGFCFIGAGMVTPNTPLFLSSLLKNNNDKVFTIFYGITNTGIILGPIVGGFIGQYFLWRGVICLNEIAILTWILFIFFGEWLQSLSEIDNLKSLKFILLVSLSNVLIYLCLSHQTLSKYILSFTILAYFAFLAWLVCFFKEYREKLVFAIVLIVFAIVFFSGEFQVASSLIAYSDNFVSLKEFNFNIPASATVSLESFFVVIGALLLTKSFLYSKIKFSQTKVLLGLLCCASAFLILYISTSMAAIGKISLFWIVFPSLLLGLGEVSLMPTIISYVAKISPDKFQGRLMSGMYFALSISGYVSGLIGERIMTHNNFTSKDLIFYQDFFVTIMIISIISVGLVGMLRFNRKRFLGIL